mmetsp:Transcript_17190/g.52021  ORF Transcript_17190/g.52021 Transcript_17190/m.52021 type:complete len:204 (+) Transcript_17190:428-1039(+)
MLLQQRIDARLHERRLGACLHLVVGDEDEAALAVALADELGDVLLDRGAELAHDLAREQLQLPRPELHLLVLQQGPDGRLVDVVEAVDAATLHGPHEVHEPLLVQEELQVLVHGGLRHDLPRVVPEEAAAKAPAARRRPVGLLRRRAPPALSLARAVLAEVLAEGAAAAAEAAPELAHDNSFEFLCEAVVHDEPVKLHCWHDH